VETDGGHAFYLGVELARAHIAWQLGKRYNQDEPLQWGCQVDAPEEQAVDPHAYKPAGTTLQKASHASKADDSARSPAERELG
jgi:hypothetical protein